MDKIEYKGYVIVVKGDIFFVQMPDISNSLMFCKTLDEAKSLIDYVNLNRSKWI